MIIRQGCLVAFHLLLISDVLSTQVTSPESYKTTFLKFANQPTSECSTKKTLHQVNCSSGTSAAVEWEVISTDSGVNFPFVNETNEVINITCSGPCRLLVTCFIRNQSEVIRSRTASVSLGVTDCSGTALNSEITQPEPAFTVIRATRLSNVNLSCIVPYQGEVDSKLTRWVHNGKELFADTVFEADGNYNIERHLKGGYWLWTNLTIFQALSQHNGYYQCFYGEFSSFNIVYLDVPVLEGGAISLETPEILKVIPNEYSGVFDILFHSSSLSFTTSSDEISKNHVNRLFSLNFSIGVIRQQLSTNASSPKFLLCSGGNLLGGANTWFSPPLVANQVNTVVHGIRLPSCFYVDQSLCHKFYEYAVFVKFFSVHLSITSTSQLVPVNFSAPVEKNLTVLLELSGTHYACIGPSNPSQFTSNCNRVLQQLPLVPNRHEYLQSHCSCKNGNAIAVEDSSTAEISLERIPFITRGLIPNASYCISNGDQDAHCIDFVTTFHINASKPQTLTFERLDRSSSIAVAWSMANCQGSLTGSWSVQLHYNNSRSSIPVKACSGRVVFENVKSLYYRHDASFSNAYSDLAAIAIPATYSIANLASFVVGRSTIILTWTVVGFASEPSENQKVIEASYSIYACLPSTLIEPTYGVMDKKILKCFGCRYVTRVSAHSVHENDVMHAQMTGFDEYVNEFQFVIWGDVSLATFSESSDRFEIHDMAPVGVIGKINVSLSQVLIEKQRPKNVSLKKIVKANGSMDLNITWSPPTAPRNEMHIHMYAVRIVPISSLLVFDDYNNQDDIFDSALVRVVEPTENKIYISNFSNSLISGLVYDQQHFNSGSSNFATYFLQIIPVWLWEHLNKAGTVTFLLDGSASVPTLFNAFAGVPSNFEISRDMLREKIANELFNSRNQRPNRNENNTAHLIEVLPIPVAAILIGSIVALILGMYLIYRCQVHNFKKKYPISVPPSRPRDELHRMEVLSGSSMEAKPSSNSSAPLLNIPHFRH